MSSWQKFKESFISKESSSQNSNQSSSSWQKYKSIAIKKREDDDREKMLQNKITEAERDQQERQAKREEQDAIVRKVQEEREQKLKEQREASEQEMKQREQQYAEQLAELQKNISTSPTEQMKKINEYNNPENKLKQLKMLKEIDDEHIKNIQEGDLKKADGFSPSFQYKSSPVAESISDFHKNNTGAILKNLFLGSAKGLMNFKESGVSAIDRTYDDYDKMADQLINNTNKIREEKGFEPLPTAKESKKIILGDSYNKDLFGRDKEEQQKKWENKKSEIDEKIVSNIESTDSAVGRKLAELTPSIGQQLPGYVLPNGLGLTYFTGSAKGAYMEDAKARGMSEEDANAYSGIMALGEGFTDMIGAKITKGIGKNIAKGNPKNALKLFGLDIAENFIEEAVMEPISETTATLTGGKETANWDNIGKRMLNSGLDGALSSIIMAGTSAGVGKAVQLTNKVNNNQQVTQQEISEAVKETLESDKVKQEELKEIIKENTNEIIKQEISEIQEQGMTQEQNMIPMETASNEGSYSKQIENNQETKVELDKILNNKDLPMQGYKYEASDNAKINQLRQQASQYFNNSEEAHKFVGMLEKIITDKDIEIRLDANLKTADGRVANGSYSNGVITINPNSSRTGEFIAIHELTHAIGTKSMMNMVENYRKSNAEFNSAVESLLQNYNATELTEEALSDVSAQLFGNQEFINNIANTNPGFFKKIYNEIKYLWHQFRGYKNQNQFIEDLYHKWTQAYNSSNQLNGETNYSIAGRNAIENIKYQHRQEYNEAMNAYYNAKKMARKGISNERIRKETNWFQDKKGKWKFEFSDKDMEIKPYIFKKNTEYDLEQVLQHDTLFKYYPELRKYSVVFQDLKGINASYSRSKHLIRLDERKFNSRLDEAGTLLHEIQHAIQQIEGFSSGASTKKGIMRYYKNLGEIEATDTRVRMLQEKQGDTLKEAPESSKKHPIHPDLKELNAFDKARFYIYNSIVDMSKKGGKKDGEVHSITQEDSGQDRYMVVGRERIKDTENSNKSSFSMDNKGRTLTKEQQEYFKDSKVRDENGNLLTVYHGTDSEFNEYTNIKTEPGYWFTENKEYASEHGKNIKEQYLNLINPIDDVDKMWDLGKDFFGNNVEEKQILSNEFKEHLKSLGYDGMVWEHSGSNTYIAFNSNQIKNIDNTNPTSNPDIRYSISEDTENGVKALEKYEENKKLAYKKIADEFGRGENYWEANLDRQDKESIKRFLKMDSFVREKYIKDNNIKIETVYEPVEYRAIGSNNEKVQNFIKDNDITVLKLAKDINLRNEYFNLVEQALQEKYNKGLEDAQEITKQWKDYFEAQSHMGETIIWALKRFESDFKLIKSGETQQIDIIATTENERKVLDNSKEFDSYVEKFANLLTDGKPQLSTEELTELAQDTFGTTTDFNFGAYMTSDGKLLNFEYGGYRTDHRDINSIGYNIDEFINAGNIRMKPEGNGFELALEPTSEQYDTLSDYIDSLNGDVYIEIDVGRNKYDGADYKKGTPTRKIISDLQYYFKNGKFPTKSEFADFRYSQNNESWQQHLDKNFKATGTRTNMKDIGINVAPTAKNNVAPRAGNYVLEHKQKKIMNPTEISNLKLDDANTTPELKDRRYESGNKQSSFFSNIVTDAKFLNNDLRQEMSKEDNIRYYKGITNKETLEKAYTKLQKDGQTEVLNWHSKDSKNANAEDVTEGWILLKQYQDKGDYANAVRVAKKMRDIGTTAGQTIQAYNILSRLTPEGMFYYAQSELSEAYNKMVEGKSKKWIEENQSKFDLTPEETQSIMDIMQDVATMEDGYDKKAKIAEVQKIITDKLPPSAGQSIKAWMRISMLFNTKTQVRNVMGNAVVMPVNAGSDIFASALDKLIAKKTGVRTTGTTKLKKYGKGFLKGLYESYNDFRKGINTRNIEGNRFEVSEGKSFKNKGIGKALNGLDSMLSFALDAGDRGFYEATFVNSINNQLVLNNTKEVTQDMIDIATTEALQRTWQDNNAYTQSVLTIRNILNGKVGKYKGMKYGLGDVLIPFAKTPANLTKAMVDYSPAGLVKTLVTDARKFKNSLENGQYSPQLQHRFVQNLGKGMAGTVLYTIAYALAKTGIATGESDEDKDVKNFMKNSLGISSYSIKIGNKSFTYDWAQPISAPLSIMTNIVNSENKGTALLEAVIGNLDTAGSVLLEQSFMEALNEVTSDADGPVSGIINQVLELPSRAVPTFSKQIADMVDGTQRTTFEYKQPLKTAYNSIVAKVPGLSKTLPASIDTLGNEIQKYGGNNNIFNVMFNPANTNKGKLSKAGEEIYNVYNQTGDKTIFPRTAPYYIKHKSETIDMNAHQRSEFQTISGKYVENSMNKLLNDSDYKKLDDEAKAEIINEIVSDSYSKAKYDVLKIDSEDYAKLRETLKNVSSGSYYNYKFKTKDMKKDSDKIDVLIDAKYTNKEKTALYEQYILASNDKKYPIIKETFTENGLNITKYLKYKNQDFSADRKDDGSIKGESIYGSGKQKRKEYIENMGITYTQGIILYGLECSPSDGDKRQIVNYIKTLPGKTNQEKLDMLSSFEWVTIYKNGSIKY